MIWFTVPTELQSIVFDYAGSLKNEDTRRRRFLKLELECWGTILGAVPKPSTICRYYGYVGRDALKLCLHEAYTTLRLEAIARIQSR